MLSRKNRIWGRFIQIVLDLAESQFPPYTYLQTLIRCSSKYNIYLVIIKCHHILNNFLTRSEVLFSLSIFASDVLGLCASVCLSFGLSSLLTLFYFDMEHRGLVPDSLILIIILSNKKRVNIHHTAEGKCTSYCLNKYKVDIQLSLGPPWGKMTSKSEPIMLNLF